jgi:hypothetical protein
MSTKTTFKRVALVAVASLGFGVLSSVSPASAADADVVTDVASLNVNAVSANYTTVQREDVAFTVNVGFTVGTVTSIDADEEVTIKAVFTSKPALSTLVGVGTTALDAGSDGGATAGAVASTDGTGVAAGSLVATPEADGVLITDTSIGSIDFTPDVPGSYVVRIWHDQNADGFYNAGTEVTRTITVVAGGIPASMTVATYGSTGVVTDDFLDANEDGSLIKILLKDTAGNATQLASGEGLTVTGTGSVTLNGTADTITLTSSTTVDISGDMIVNVKKAAAGASTITIAAAGTIASAFASQTASLTFKAASDEDAATVVVDETTGVSGTAWTAGNVATVVNAPTAKTTIAHELTSVAAGTTRYVALNVVDTTGAITGVAGASYTTAVAISDDEDGVASFDVTAATWSATTRAATGASGADSYILYILDSAPAGTINNSSAITITAAAAAVSAANSDWNISSVSAVSALPLSVPV